MKNIFFNSKIMINIFIKIMIKKRLDLIVKELGYSGRGFEKACGLKTGSYSSLSDGMGADKLKKILITFPQISMDWLLTEKGEMFKTSNDTTSPIQDPETSVYKRLYEEERARNSILEQEIGKLKAFMKERGIARNKKDDADSALSAG